HYTQALTTSNRALVIADELRVLAWKAETLMHRGAAFAALNRLDESNAAFREAGWTGLEGHSEVIAGRGAGRTAVVAASHNAAGEAQIWLDLAKVMVARAGHDPWLELIALRAEASVAAARGDMAAALAAQQKVLAGRERAFGRDSPELWLDHQ